METAAGAAVTPAFERLNQIMGCKWSMGILTSIEQGVARPSRIERTLDGISTKVMHRCINKLEVEGFIARETFQEVPPRVEYRLTEKGEVLMKAIHHVQSLAQEWSTLNPLVL